MANSRLSVIHRSNVNAWECDENGHLNVRYYIGKNHQGLTHLLADNGLTPARLTALGVRPRVLTQHVRYHREALVSAPLVGNGGLVSADGAHLTLYSELGNSMDDTLYTTFNSEVVMLDRDGVPVEVTLDARTEPVAVPEQGAVRSLPAVEQPRHSHTTALTAGYIETGRGTVMAHECDRDGRLEVFQYAGRIADAIPNFMSTMQTPEEYALRAAGELGGAVIESRASCYTELLAGQRFVLLSGLNSFTPKLMFLHHLMFELETGTLAFHSQGVGVALDLKARRAVPFADDRQALMRARLVDTQ